MTRKRVAIGVGAVMVVAFAVWWTWYSYQDCLKVGHSKLYCIMRAGR